ncbi:hypothetical protein ALC56_06279 [Trachymyrmex septentrionalis]|uniref:Uncharacterized protein n=1 Tax=Trachymyrmex septentrionalis TaxID=34720 RepID=A0A195FG34_9HYME|nr:hypothetical protein ALC56_06279 [Trachymyrmex septentrionalis]
MRKAAKRNEVVRVEAKDSAAKVLYKRFTACKKELVRKAGAPPAAFLETKRKLEETGGDWFQPVARRGGRTGGDPLSS